MHKNAFTIAEFCRRNGVGKTFVYEEIRSGRLHAVKAGRRTLISATAEQRWLTSLPDLQVPDRKVGGNA